MAKPKSRKTSKYTWKVTPVTETVLEATDAGGNTVMRIAKTSPARAQRILKAAKEGKLDYMIEPLVKGDK